MSSLEDQLSSLQAKLNQANAFKFLADYITNKLTNDKKLIHILKNQDALSYATTEIGNFARKCADSLELGTFIEHSVLSYEDVALLKEMVDAFRTKKLGGKNEKRA